MRVFGEWVSVCAWFRHGKEFPVWDVGSGSVSVGRSVGSFEGERCGCVEFKSLAAHIGFSLQLMRRLGSCEALVFIDCRERRCTKGKLQCFGL